MMRFDADDFCRVSSLLGQMYMDIRCGRIPRDQTWVIMATELRLLRDHCQRIGLAATVAQIERTAESITGNHGYGFDLDVISRDLIQVQLRLNDELKGRVLYAIDSDKAVYMTDSQFDPKVSEVFPDAAFDMDEAAKCYALNRATACVFHLMRVTEYGLQAVGKTLGMKDDRPNWEPIIAKIDSEIKKPYKDRQFKGQTEVLAHISSHMHAVKIAWRNRAMHIEKKHTIEEAREIYDATRGLMRYLAENLPKPATGTLTVIREKLGL
ncbi:MAG TPA: hypothetical protein VFL57_00390 [Bryobacteraceae bacterium]|nr:hypothetical protein [Bryobacteraceae bacterium]